MTPCPWCRLLVYRAMPDIPVLGSDGPHLISDAEDDGLVDRGQMWLWSWPVRPA